MKYLVTGAAGFIGYHVTQYLLANNHEVIGLDNLNDYYSQQLKSDRLKQISNKHFKFFKLDITDQKSIARLFKEHNFDVVIHLAAQAGVRYSIEHPHTYISSNIDGFLNILEGCRFAQSVKHLVYASSSSVYGCNVKQPFAVDDPVDHPISLYAATKKANELMAHTYSHLYNIPTTGLRFFTVYGPWGRPDMALFKFTQAIMNNEVIDVYNHGQMKRDFTYIDDIVKGVISISEIIPSPEPQLLGKDIGPHISHAPYRIYNIGNNQPVELEYFIEVIENKIGKKAQKNYLPTQMGDVPSTYADIDDISLLTGFKSTVTLNDGIANFIDWFNSYYQI